MTLFNKDLNDPEIIHVIDPNVDYLAELVGEDKKFKTPADLARAKAQSDAFIKNLERELAETRQKANEAITMKEFLTKLEASKVKGDQEVNNQNTNTNQPTNDETTKTQALSEEDIVRVLESRDQLKTQTANFNEVKAALRSAWGENHVAVLQAKVAEMGVSQEFLDNLAKTQPKAFLKLMDIESAASSRQEDRQTLAPRNASVNTQSKQEKVSQGLKTHKDFAKLRDSDPRAYFTPKIQNLRMAQAQLLGDAFYD